MPLRSRRLLACLALAACIASPSVLAADAPPSWSLVARGNEPFWRLTLGPDGARLDAPDPALVFAAPSLERSTVDGRPRVTASAGGRTLVVEIDQRTCADTMTGMPFPVGVRVDLDGKRLTGCGGDTMTSIEGGWRVIRLGDDLPPNGAVITLVFGLDGRISGRAACNRFSGPYALTGEGLSFGELAATRMACPPDLMETESRVFALLKSVDRVTPGEDGRLRLMAADATALVLDRAR